MADSPQLHARCVMGDERRRWHATAQLLDGQLRREPRFGDEQQPVLCFLDSQLRQLDFEAGGQSEQLVIALSGQDQPAGAALRSVEPVILKPCCFRTLADQRVQVGEEPFHLVRVIAFRQAGLEKQQRQLAHLWNLHVRRLFQDSSGQIHTTDSQGYRDRVRSAESRGSRQTVFRVRILSLRPFTLTCR